MLSIGLSLFCNRNRKNARPVPRRAPPAQNAGAPAAQRSTFAPPRLPREQPALVALRNAFTPTRPQRSFRRLAGRKSELLRILQAIAENRAHVILFGDRGRGKT